MSKGTSSPRILAVLCLVIFATSWGVARAAEPAAGTHLPWQAPLAAPRPAQAATPPLLHVLPTVLSSGHAPILKVEVLRDGDVVIRQEIQLPARLAEGSVVALLAEPVNERTRLEEMEAASPGSVRVELSVGDQLVDQISFPELQEETRDLTPLAKPTVGDPQRLDVLIGNRPIRLGAKAIEDGRDPDCVQHCDDDRYDCYVNRCDPRGSCEYCETYYTDCVLGCPICPTTHDTSTTTVLSQSFYNQYGCFLGFFAGTGAVHRLSYRTLRLKVWRTVTQCDGSSTTTLITNTTYSESCWQELPPPNNLCSPWGLPGTYPICFPF